MKVQSTHTLEPKCDPLAVLLKQISGQWTLYILCVLDKEEALRFGKLKTEVSGISTKVLTDRLRMLEANGIVHRYHEPTIPPKVTYSLTEQGKELSYALEHLCSLASQWYGSVDEEI